MVWNEITQKWKQLQEALMIDEIHFVFEIRDNSCYTQSTNYSSLNYNQKNMSVSIVVGAQWGDEGKGKIVDMLSEKIDIVARYQGCLLYTSPSPRD